jgi:hypothetical protein
LISLEVWKKHFRDICYLIGNPNPPREQGDILYKRLQHFDECDFIAACNDDAMIAELSLKRLNMPTLKYFIELHQNKRVLAEHKAEKEKSAEDLRRFYANQDMPEETRRAIDLLLGRTL